MDTTDGSKQSGTVYMDAERKTEEKEGGREGMKEGGRVEERV